MNGDGFHFEASFVRYQWLRNSIPVTEALLDLSAGITAVIALLSNDDAIIIHPLITLTLTPI